LGDSKNINVEKDLAILQKQLPDAYILPLFQPRREQLSDQLWEQNWDILFFAGHSTSATIEGRIYINDEESLTIKEIKFALRKAIESGLQLAIFNSCDGLKLAEGLEDLQLATSIVMREQISDQAAQKFLAYFLKPFANEGKPLYISVREARERLQTLENQYPCLSWLPVICEHPTAPTLTWRQLGGLLPCPYRGLSAFQEDDQSVFFGRENFTNLLLEAVKIKPLVAVIGSSGSGKSSVVFAGLLPRLRQKASSKLPLKIAAFRPGKNPFDALAIALLSVQNIPDNNIDRKIAELELADELKSNPNRLSQEIETIVRQGNCQRFVLVADQFEELYTLCSETEYQVFLDGLLIAINKEPGFTLILTLRADFFGRVLGYEPFGQALQQYPPELLIPMNVDELREAIAKPSQQLGIELEQGLTERLINAVSKRPGYLPLLEFVLTQLWEKQKQNILSHAAYEEIGGIENALTNYAEEVYIQLEEIDRQRLQKIFIQLVNPGKGTEDTRRLATRSQVGEENWDLVTYLASIRLVVTNGSGQTGEETVEIVHEALIQNWKQLQLWIQRNRDFRSWQERLRMYLNSLKTQHNFNEDVLLRGAQLAEAKEWLQQRPDEISPSERQLIEKSIELHKQEQTKQERQKWLTVLGVSGSLLIIFTLAITTWWQGKFAEFQRQQLKISETDAQITAINAYSEKLLSDQKQFDALVQSLKAARILQQTDEIRPELRIQVAATIQQTLYHIKERNRLEQHGERIMSVMFSRDGQTIA